MKTIKTIRFPKSANVSQVNDAIQKAIPLADDLQTFIFYVPAHVLNSRYLRKTKFPVKDLQLCPMSVSSPNVEELDQMHKAIEIAQELLGDEGEVDDPHVSSAVPQDATVVAVQQLDGATMVEYTFDERDSEVSPELEEAYSEELVRREMENAPTVIKQKARRRSKEVPSVEEMIEEEILAKLQNFQD